MNIDTKDLRVEIYKAGNNNVVRVIHIPTGKSASSSEKISQYQNKLNALKLLAQELNNAQS